MRIAVLSDTHDNEGRTRRALELVQRHGVEQVLHCGDICRVGTVLQFHALPTHFVQGNNDFDLAGLRAAAEAIGSTWHGPFADLTLAGKRLAMLHGDDHRQLDQVRRDGRYDYVFFGHTHEFERNQIGRTIVINPGALHRASFKTCVVLDLRDGSLEIVEVAD